VSTTRRRDAALRDDLAHPPRRPVIPRL